MSRSGSKFPKGDKKMIHILIFGFFGTLGFLPGLGFYDENKRLGGQRFIVASLLVGMALSGLFELGTWGI
jgi:hypothetical protein